jgi:hypothetical protein
MAAARISPAVVQAVSVKASNIVNTIGTCAKALKKYRPYRPNARFIPETSPTLILEGSPPPLARCPGREIRTSMSPPFPKQGLFLDTSVSLAHAKAFADRYYLSLSGCPKQSQPNL